MPSGSDTSTSTGLPVLCMLGMSTVLPTDWPFSPPNIYFLTPNGRFRVNQKICLSISAHHPETWQPAWGIQHILQALISMLPTEGDGGIGSLNCSEEERKVLAEEVCGASKMRAAARCAAGTTAHLPCLMRHTSPTVTIMGMSELWGHLRAAASAG